MERYTEKHYGENGYYLVCSGNCETLNCGDCGILDKIVDRLAAYEDTGLEPEEVRSQKELFDYLVFDSAPSEDIERFKRLREFGEADREGRCVVLPCKVGDTVYQENGVDVFELQVKNIIFDCGYVAFDSSAIGTSIYLTHEAAEAALKAREQDG